MLDCLVMLHMLYPTSICFMQAKLYIFYYISTKPVMFICY